MELVLVRHALPQRVENADGPADPELDARGHEQSRHMADYLATEKIDGLYSSPMRRAIQTAAPLAAALDMDATIIEEVAEYDQLSPDYVPIEELKAEGGDRFRDVVAGRRDGAEGFASRVIPALDKIVAEHVGETVVVVCHGGVINLYLSVVLGLPTDTPGFFYPNYTSIHRIAASRSGIRSIVTINETSHLRNTGLPMGLFQKG